MPSKEKNVSLVRGAPGGIKTGKKPVAQRIARSNAQSRCVSNASSDSGSFSITGPTLEIELRGTEREARLLNRDVLADRCLAVYTKMAAKRSRHQRKFPDQRSGISGREQFRPGRTPHQDYPQRRPDEISASLDASPRLNVQGGYRPLQRSDASLPEGSPSILNTHGGALRFKLAKAQPFCNVDPRGLGRSGGRRSIPSFFRARELHRQLFADELGFFGPQAQRCRMTTMLLASTGGSKREGQERSIMR